jgi:hypothetical protein
MNANSYYKYHTRKAGKFCLKLFKDFVSGIPRDEEMIKTGISEFRPLKRIRLRNETGKSCYHRRERSLFQKTTLSKEKKKEKLH